MAYPCNIELSFYSRTLWPDKCSFGCNRRPAIGADAVSSGVPFINVTSTPLHERLGSSQRMSPAVLPNGNLSGFRGRNTPSFCSLGTSLVDHSVYSPTCGTLKEMPTSMLLHTQEVREARLTANATLPADCSRYSLTRDGGSQSLLRLDNR
ncbi:unnamed protein product [Protopolystoma xenopodis]|uniref:Uncharacterized protein n=1 Tax=Protopolystoma xenopodis TaxID=117903 RepID=A0A3S5B589_9PLAT|nr:unnamed protein product [Protopolystoma xenopodis]